jgi:uncharacterized membrane protein YfcA
VPSGLDLQLAYGIVTLLASLTNGILGAGGAVLFVPLALYALPPLGVRLDPHQVTALSLAQGICAFLAGSATYGRRGQVAAPQVWLGGPALGAGALAGGVVSARAPAMLLVVLFALVVTAAAMLLLIPPGEPRRRGAWAQVTAAAVFLGIGTIGGAVGVGAGVLLIPVLIYLLGTPQRVASGTSLVLPVFISGPAFAGKALSGQVPWSLVPLVAATALGGVWVGARVHQAISRTALRVSLATLTGVLAVGVWARLLFPT